MDDRRDNGPYLMATSTLVALAMALSSVMAFWVGIRYERRRSVEYRAVATEQATVDLGLCKDALAVNDRILSDLWPGWGRKSYREPISITPSPSPTDDLE